MLTQNEKAVSHVAQAGLYFNKKLRIPCLHLRSRVQDIHSLPDGWVLGSEIHAYQASILPSELHLQPCCYSLIILPTLPSFIKVDNFVRLQFCPLFFIKL